MPRYEVRVTHSWTETYRVEAETVVEAIEAIREEGREPVSHTRPASITDIKAALVRGNP